MTLKLNTLMLRTISGLGQHFGYPFLPVEFIFESCLKIREALGLEAVSVLSFLMGQDR